MQGQRAAVDLNDRMVVLVRDVADFMTSAERALSPEEGIRTYNARLAQIYLDEQAIGGVPINRGVATYELLMRAIDSVTSD